MKDKKKDKKKTKRGRCGKCGDPILSDRDGMCGHCVGEWVANDGGREELTVD